MTRALLKIVILCGLVVAGAFTLSHYQQRTDADRELDAARGEVADLRHAVERLTADRRVAELLVTDQRPGPDGVTRTTLLVEEYAADGSAIPPLRVTLVGDEAHVDATVIAFDNNLVEAGDPLRGHSLSLFTRIFGNRQTPADGTPIDNPQRLAELDRGSDPRVTPFQRSLWAEFWRLAEDADYRKVKGVRAAFGSDVWFPCRPGRLYTVVLQANGGLTQTSEPLRGIYRDALHPPG